jgi:ATP-binding cassette subfamily B (MDR/TAP) protein 1
LQEVNKESELAVDDQNKPEITVESFRQSSQRMSIQRSISRGSSGVGNSSHHSFSVSFGLPTAVNVPDIAWEEPDTPSLPTEQLPEVPLRRMAYLNKPEIPVLIIGAIAAIMNGVIFPIFGVLISGVIKTFYEPPKELKKDSEFWALIFLVLGLASFLVIPARSYFFAVAGCKLIQRIRVLCFEKVVNMEVSWFDEPEHSSGAIGARLSADAASVRALVGDALGQMVENIASAVAGLLIAFIASWQLALIILVFLPLIGINGFIQVKFMKGFSADAKVCFKTNASPNYDCSMLNIFLESAS